MKILSAMSGGVDSSVATALLVNDGHDVVGAYMRNWINEEGIAGDCPWQQDIEDANAVAGSLGIELRVLNLMDDYRERVVKYLLDGCAAGITPNPDVMCNREMKFGILLDYARDQGFDAIATGHYARRIESPGGLVSLARGADPGKDQSYFLALLSQDQIAAARFPIGHLRKRLVREKAAQMGLATAGKKDSQGICFVGDVRMSDFLGAFLPEKPGPIVDTSGRLLGEHRGLHLYTLGQRRGLGVSSPFYKEPYVVVAKEMAHNRLVVAPENADTPLLFAQRARVGSLHATGAAFWDAPRRLQAQPRYRHPGADARIEPLPDGQSVEVTFDVPQRALTPGQICAFYDGDILLGGGVFEEVSPLARDTEPQ
jgi:tRNA-specific 2-thiouridylase